MIYKKYVKIKILSKYFFIISWIDIIVNQF
nr:MAG TPA: hypothetical protein [Caudoviricetes sp.]